MNRDKFLRILGANPDTWATRYGLTARERPCPRCGRLLQLSIPFAYGRYRGLMCAPCECGNRRTPYSFVVDPKRGDLLDAN